MEMFVLYLWTRVDNIRDMFVLFGFLLGFAAVALLLCHLAAKGSGSITSGATLKVGKRLAAISIAALLVFCATPTKTDIAVLAAGHLTLEAAKSEEAQKLKRVLLMRANEAMDRMLEGKQ